MLFNRGVAVIQLNMLFSLAFYSVRSTHFITFGFLDGESATSSAWTKFEGWARPRNSL